MDFPITLPRNEMVLMSGAGMLGTQFQQRGEEPDTFKVRAAHATDSARWRVTGLSFFLQVRFQSRSKQSLSSL